MTTPTAEATPTAGRSRWHAVLVMAVFALSLFLRLERLDLFLGGDETKWICRGINFHAALQERRWADTYQSEHPGVVTMWIGTLALPLDTAGDWVYWCDEMGGDKLTRVDDQATLLALPGHIAQARRALTVFVWLGLIGVYVLMRRLFGDRVAFWAALMLALDPFYLALSRVLHLDAVLTTAMLLSACALLVYLYRGRQRRYLVLSALAGGLAIANKTPGLFMGGWAALALGVEAWRSERSARGAHLRRAAVDLLLWGGLALGLVVALWPALWVTPMEALRQVFGAALGYAEAPHGNSNYFWHAIRPDPGPAFYPVAWAFRTTPLVMLGLVALFWSRREADDQRPLIWMLIFAGLFLLFMTAGAKKFDRYGLPGFAMLDLAAACGIGWTLTRWAQRFRWPRWAATLLMALLLVGQVALIGPAFPYGLSYYNPVVGGARTAQEILLIGWGEGMEAAAQYLNQKPDVDDFHVNTAHISQFAPFFRGHTSSASDLDLGESDYYVFYANTIQRLREPEVLTRFYGVVDPEKVISANGIDYVWIYRNHLQDDVLAYLEREARAESDAILVDINSTLLRQYDGPAPIVRVDATTGRDTLAERLREIAEGRDRLLYVTYPESPGDPRGVLGDLLAEAATSVSEQSWQGVTLRTYTLGDPPHFIVPEPEIALGAALGEAIVLRGASLAADDQGLSVELYWRAERSVGASYTVFVHLLDEAGELVAQHDGLPGVGQRTTDDWVVDETVIDPHRIAWPEEAAPDATYRLICGLYDAASGLRLPVSGDQGIVRHDQAVLVADGLSQAGD